ncbi:MAG: hypothetical protein BYD32DRAFT_193770 [Podila humilis]|nr:MAG: hypothetical protein BYD32DRAFT_193770 [Podila humilis]
MPADFSGSPTECVVDLFDQSSGTQTVADSNLNTSTTSLTLSGTTISAKKSLSLHVIPKASSSDSSTQLPLVANALQETLEPDSSSQSHVFPEQQDSTPTPFVDDPAIPTELQEIKWYFEKSAILAYPEDEASYNCTTKFHPHFSANASKRFRSWKACVEDLDVGAYDIVLEVSTSKLILDYIEFITFTIHPNMNSSYTDFYDFNDRVNERIPNAGLRKLCEQSSNNPNGRFKENHSCLFACSLTLLGVFFQTNQNYSFLSSE